MRKSDNSHILKWNIFTESLQPERLPSLSIKMLLSWYFPNLAVLRGLRQLGLDDNIHTGNAAYKYSIG